MARAYSVESVEYAPVTVDGSLPTTGWKKISPISDDAVGINIPPVAVTEIRAQDIGGVVEVLPGDTEAPNIAFASLEVDGAVAADLIGGTWDAVNKAYDAPVGDVLKSWAYRVTSKPLNGEKVVFHFKNMTTLSNITASLVRNDLVRLSYTARAKTPVNALGEAVSPWGWKVIDATPAG